MARTTRIAAIMAVAAAMVLVAAIPALAKGPGDPSVRMVMVTGPGINPPYVFTQDQAMFVARDTGMLDVIGSHTITSLLAASPSSLGTKYTLTYVLSSEGSASSGAAYGDEITQDFYPYSRGGPVVFTPSGQGLPVTGWSSTTASVVGMLEAAGALPAPAVVHAQQTLPQAPASDPIPWALWIALGIVALIPLVDLAVGGRRRSTVVAS